MAGKEYGIHPLRGADRGCVGERSGTGDVLRNDGADESGAAGPEWCGNGWESHGAADGISRAGFVDDRRAQCGLLQGTCARAMGAASGFRRDEVMAVGDNHNDVEMLEFAGHPVIMGNACEELRGRGWSVTLGNDRCGVAAAVAEVVNT